MTSVAQTVRKQLKTPRGMALMEQLPTGQFMIPQAAEAYRAAQAELPALEMNLVDAYRDPAHNAQLQHIWDTGDAHAREAAGLKYRPSSTSDHLYGRAIDQHPRFEGRGDLQHQYLEAMARHGFFYDTPGDPVHLGFYANGNVIPSKQEAVNRLRKEMEDRAGYGAYEDWRRLNKLAADESADPADYDYATAYRAHAMADEDTGHLSDIGKRPSHITFSDESAYSGVDGNPVGGHWSLLPDSGGHFVFDSQPVNVTNAGGAQKLYDYFGRNERGQAGLILPEISQEELDETGGGPATSLANPFSLRDAREEQASMNMAEAVRGASRGR